ncbi:hypothetical protein [Dehalogenimonas etheniformans]|uniref:hypothetical protein n=2 Tax=Dehalogenimonas etheniformans TaxID=1536648 RepID=UPI00167F9B41|nr:hypothetical protein [Dehalogenimonas etheniformans]QNT76588.1 hypothetical protein HX448_07785 [Dehalogenimonas etheniformans]
MFSDIKMMNHSEIAIISAAVLAYLESEGMNVATLDETRLRAIITVALASYLETESTVSV